MPGDEFYLRAFYQLSTCRRYQGGPIPWDLVAAYADAWRLSASMGIALSIIVRKLDDAYLAWWKDESERQAEQQRSQGQGPGGKLRGAWNKLRGRRG